MPAFDGYSDAKFSDAQKNLNDLKKIGVKIIDFTGGEPLLNHDLPRILSHAKQLGFITKLSTNGILYPEQAEELRGLVHWIYFSLDTTSREEYERIRGVDGYDKVVESIQIAKTLNQNICLTLTVTNENVDHISTIFDFCRKNKVTVLVHPCFSYFENQSLNRENILKIKKYFWKPYVRMNLPYLDFYFKGGNDIYHPKCKSGRSTIDISPDNCLTTPCFFRTTKKVQINGKLLSLYNSSKWGDLFRNAGKYDFCEHCTFECYFGLSYWDRVLGFDSNIYKQNLTIIKDTVEFLRTYSFRQ